MLVKFKLIVFTIRQFQDGNCEDGNSCCYAHSENEAFVWDGNVGLWELSHHSMRNRMSQLFASL